MKKLIQTLLNLQNDKDSTIDAILSMEQVNSKYNQLIYKPKLIKKFEKRKKKKGAKAKYEPIKNQFIKEEFLEEYKDDPKMKMFLKNKNPNKVIVEAAREMLLLRDLENKKLNEKKGTPTPRSRRSEKIKNSENKSRTPKKKKHIDFTEVLLSQDEEDEKSKEEIKIEIVEIQKDHEKKVENDFEDKKEEKEDKKEKEVKEDPNLSIPPVHAKHNVKSSRLLEIYEKNRKRGGKKSKNKKADKTQKKLKFLVGKKFNNPKKMIGQRSKKPTVSNKSTKTNKTGKTDNTVITDNTPSLLISEKVMKSMIMEKKPLPKNIKRNRRNKSETPHRKANPIKLKLSLRPFTSSPPKYEDITKNFNQWFTEDYFENCLILDGEFGFDYFSEINIKQISQKKEEKQINIKRSFVKKKRVEKVVDTPLELKDDALEVRSNKRVPLALSNEYTVSNNRNQIGREVKEFLEEKSRQFHTHKSTSVKNKNKSHLPIKQNFDSIQLTMHLNKVRNLLRVMKEKEEKKGSIRSKSCHVKMKKKEKKSTPKNLKEIQSSKNIGINTDYYFISYDINSEEKGN